VYSRLRQAKHTHAQRSLELDKTRAAVRASVSSAWEGLSAARAQIVAARQQVRAARIALNGVRQEAKVGQRTTLDVLNAQQELLDANVSLVLSERNATVAAYSLLSAIGRLNARYLALPVKIHDPAVNYKRVQAMVRSQGHQKRLTVVESEIFCQK
jgi:outer membrane protein